MNEMEKLQRLLDGAGENDRRDASEAAEAITAMIHGLIGSMPDYLLNGVRPQFDFARARDALAVLNRIGEPMDIRFDCPEPDRELGQYLVQFARDVLFSGRP